MIKNMPLKDKAPSLKNMLNMLNVGMMLPKIHPYSRRITRILILVIRFWLILLRQKISKYMPMNSMDIVIIVTSLATRMLIVESKRKI